MKIGKKFEYDISKSATNPTVCLSAGNWKPNKPEKVEIENSEHFIKLPITKEANRKNLEIIFSKMYSWSQLINILIQYCGAASFLLDPFLLDYNVQNS
jgi:hypothetical protein